MANALEFGFDIFCSRNIAIGEVPEVELHTRLEAPLERTSSIVIARLPWSIVDAKCQGASRCVVQCVERRTHSKPQPSPSGSSPFLTRKEFEDVGCRR